MSTDPALHKKHRSRLRARYRQEGLTGFAPHNVLELLLTFAIPRRDTNETAHRLLARFGSLSGVFRASFDELTQVEGVGERCAELICLMRDVRTRIRMDEAESSLRYTDREALYSYLTELYSAAKDETVCALFFDAKEHLIRTETLFVGSVETCIVRKRSILEAGMKSGASFFILAHNHPNGDPTPSESDLRTTQSLTRLFRELDMPLADHLIVGRSGVVSLRGDEPIPSDPA